MSVDVLYLARNRLEYTEFSYGMLMVNTEWDLVDNLIVYDDGSEDGTLEWLRDKAHRPPCEFVFRQTDGVGPVGVMNHYLDKVHSQRHRLFAKVDNDIVVPPEWLSTMLGVMRRNPDLELLGMEAGQSGLLAPLSEDGHGRLVHHYLPCSHIGGVGLMRTSAFTTKPKANGRFGFTEWQHERNPLRGWVQPDLLVAELSRVPLEPWDQYSLRYLESGWERPWGKYDTLRAQYWSWWP